jgi:hypothetical protein
VIKLTTAINQPRRPNTAVPKSQACRRPDGIGFVDEELEVAATCFAAVSEGALAQKGSYDSWMIIHCNSQCLKEKKQTSRFH